MTIKSMRVDMRIPWAQSLKDKRMVVKSVLARTRERFNVSAEETDFRDAHKTAGLTFVCVAHDTFAADGILEHTLCYIENHYEAEVTAVEYEVR